MKTYSKEGDKLVVTDTISTETKFDLKHLKRIKQELKSQIDEIDLLIAKCTELNVKEVKE